MLFYMQMTLIMHNLQSRELKPISCAQMQDLFCGLLINLRFMHSMPEEEHMYVNCARVGGALPKILHTPQQMCNCAPGWNGELVDCL